VDLGVARRRSAFEQVCRDEYASVVRAAYLVTGDREEALDIAQEAFERAYARWGRVGDLDRPGAWVQHVAVNIAISWRRRQRIRRSKPALAEPIAGPPPEPDLELMAALLALTPAQRGAVVLRHFADRSVEEVASALGKRPGTVRALTAQAVARLREMLTREEEVNDELSI
jgi:RNA polymerase sigma-70 factor (ECF subfamily)